MRSSGSAESGSATPTRAKNTMPARIAARSARSQIDLHTEEHAQAAIAFCGDHMIERLCELEVALPGVARATESCAQARGRGVLARRLVHGLAPADLTPIEEPVDGVGRYERRRGEAREAQ